MAQSLAIDRHLYPEYRNVEAAISSSPLILVAGLKQYLDNFPYGCTEQTVSAAFPQLYYGDLSDLMQAGKQQRLVAHLDRQTDECLRQPLEREIRVG